MTVIITPQLNVLSPWLPNVKLFAAHRVRQSTACLIRSAQNTQLQLLHTNDHKNFSV